MEKGAPAMVICNLRTPAGLVNGATGTVVGVVLRSDKEDSDLRGAVSAADVAYVVLDVRAPDLPRSPHLGADRADRREA